jgi:hypothetical protein
MSPARNARSFTPFRMTERGASVVATQSLAGGKDEGAIGLAPSPLSSPVEPVEGEEDELLGISMPA